MSPEQWNSLQSSLNSIHVLLFALAKTSDNPQVLRKVFREQREILETFSINSRTPEQQLSMLGQKLNEIEKVIWG